MIDLADAQSISLEIRESLLPWCDVIRVAGSIRRKQPTVKDAELVYIPKYQTAQPVQTSFLDNVPVDPVNVVSQVDGRVDTLVDQGVLEWDTQVKRNGPLHKRLIHPGSGMVVELFGATPENWGLVFAIRTGPADYNRTLVTTKFLGGGLPHGMRMEGGHLWYLTMQLPTPTEPDFFGLLQVPHWPPKLRTRQRLIRWLSQQPDTRWYPTTAVKRLGIIPDTTEFD